MAARRCGSARPSRGARRSRPRRSSGATAACTSSTSTSATTAWTTRAATRAAAAAPYPGPTTLVLARSRDRGATWTSPGRRRARPDQALPRLPAAVPLGGGRRRRPRLRRLPQRDARRSRRLAVVAGARGVVLDGPVRVNDTKRRDGTAQYLPKLAVAPDGRLDVLYYDRRADPREPPQPGLAAVLLRPRRVVHAAVKLSSGPSDSRIGFGAKEGLPDLGSRLALVSSDRAALGLWTDTRAGIPETQKQDLAAAAVAVSDPHGCRASPRARCASAASRSCLAGLALLALGLRGRGATRSRVAPALEPTAAQSRDAAIRPRRGRPRGARRGARARRRRGSRDRGRSARCRRGRRRR